MGPTTRISFRRARSLIHPWIRCRSSKLRPTTTRRTREGSAARRQRQHQVRTDSFHGTAYDFLRNRCAQRSQLFASPTANKPEFTRNQFGASVGGPMLRDRLFAFLNYEGDRERQNQIATTQVFTRCAKSGRLFRAVGSRKPEPTPWAGPSLRGRSSTHFPFAASPTAPRFAMRFQATSFRSAG